METISKKTGLFAFGIILLFISLFVFWAAANMEFLLDRQIFVGIALGVAISGSVVIAKSAK